MPVSVVVLTEVVKSEVKFVEVYTFRKAVLARRIIYLKRRGSSWFFGEFGIVVDGEGLGEEVRDEVWGKGSSVASTRPVAGRLLKSRLFVLSNLLTVTQPPASRDFD